MPAAQQASPGPGLSLLQIAWKNVRHRALSYAAFLLGSSFAVWMLFLYSWLLGHPAMAPILRETGAFLRMTQVVTAFFSVFFILQAHGSFLRARQKELGVLTVLGLLPRQLSRLVRWENLIIGTGSTLTGILAGNVCTRLFGLLFLAILHRGADLPYYFSWPATLICALLFPAVMTLASLFSNRRLQRLPLADLLTGSARPKAPPRRSAWQAVLGAVLLLGVYGALLFTRDGLLPAPVLLLAGVAGTYLCISQGSVALLTGLKQNRRLMWQPDGLLVIAPLAYRIRDNVGTLFLTSLMSTAVMALTAFNYSVHLAGALRLSPTISYNPHIAGFRIVIFSFVTLLFFLGAGNVLYFKLFTDLPEDRRQVQVLHKLGLDRGAIGRLIGKQIAILFFLPGLVAAMGALVIQVRIVPAVGPVAYPVLVGTLLIWGLLQGIYYLGTRRAYLRQVLAEAH
jgi:putative ABC transport system permease protein